jgi:hypothetical protein
MTFQFVGGNVSLSVETSAKHVPCGDQLLPMVAVVVDGDGDNGDSDNEDSDDGDSGGGDDENNEKQ